MNNNIRIRDKIKKYCDNHKKVIVGILVIFIFALFVNYSQNNNGEYGKSEGKIPLETVDNTMFSALNGTYDGDNLDAESHIAKFEFDTGDIYDGEWNKNAFEGSGKYVFADTGYYEGQFKEGVRSGNGKFVWKDGSTYDGEWENDNINGGGTYISSKGISLIGTFVENNFVKGYLLYKKDGNIYEYEIENKAPTGKITIKYGYGSKYIGSYKNKKLNGTGTLEYYNGNVYKGKFVNGKKSGYGKYTWKNGAFYEGEWLNDKMNGDGKYIYHSESKGKSLSGKFKNNNPVGLCIYRSKKSKKYKTIWNNGVCIQVRRYKK